MSRPPVFHDHRDRHDSYGPSMTAEMRGNLFAVLMLVAIVLLVTAGMLLAASCAPAKGEPACHGVTREQLTAEYLARVTALKASGKCSTYPDANDCPEYQALNEDQQRRADAWRDCR